MTPMNPAATGQSPLGNAMPMAPSMSGHTVFPRSLFGSIGRNIRPTPSRAANPALPQTQPATADVVGQMAQQAHQQNAQAKIAATNMPADRIDRGTDEAVRSWLGMSKASSTDPAKTAYDAYQASLTASSSTGGAVSQSQIAAAKLQSAVSPVTTTKMAHHTRLHGGFDGVAATAHGSPLMRAASAGLRLTKIGIAMPVPSQPLPADPNMGAMSTAISAPPQQQAAPAAPPAGGMPPPPAAGAMGAPAAPPTGMPAQAGAMPPGQPGMAPPQSPPTMQTDPAVAQSADQLFGDAQATTNPAEDMKFQGIVQASDNWGLGKYAMPDSLLTTGAGAAGGGLGGALLGSLPGMAIGGLAGGIYGGVRDKGEDESRLGAVARGVGGGVLGGGLAGATVGGVSGALGGGALGYKLPDIDRAINRIVASRSKTAGSLLDRLCERRGETREHLESRYQSLVAANLKNGFGKSAADALAGTRLAHWLDNSPYKLAGGPGGALDPLRGQWLDVRTGKPMVGTMYPVKTAAADLFNIDDDFKSIEAKPQAQPAQPAQPARPPVQQAAPRPAAPTTRPVQAPQAIQTPPGPSQGLPTRPGASGGLPRPVTPPVQPRPMPVQPGSAASQPVPTAPPAPKPMPATRPSVPPGSGMINGRPTSQVLKRGCANADEVAALFGLNRLFKTAWQDNSGPRQSASGESKNVGFAHKDDDYDRGPAAWENSSKYLKHGGGRDGRIPPSKGVKLAASMALKSPTRDYLDAAWDAMEAEDTHGVSIPDDMLRGMQPYKRPIYAPWSKQPTGQPSRQQIFALAKRLAASKAPKVASSAFGADSPQGDRLAKLVKRVMSKRVTSRGQTHKVQKTAGLVDEAKRQGLYGGGAAVAVPAASPAPKPPATPKMVTGMGGTKTAGLFGDLFKKRKPFPATPGLLETENGIREDEEKAARFKRAMLSPNLGRRLRQMKAQKTVRRYQPSQDSIQSGDSENDVKAAMLATRI